MKTEHLVVVRVKMQRVSCEQFRANDFFWRSDSFSSAQ